MEVDGERRQSRGTVRGPDHETSLPRPLSQSSLRKPVFKGGRVWVVTSVVTSVNQRSRTQKREDTDTGGQWTG